MKITEIKTIFIVFFVLLISDAYRTMNYKYILKKRIDLCGTFTLSTEKCSLLRI